MSSRSKYSIAIWLIRIIDKKMIKLIYNTEKLLVQLIIRKKIILYIKITISIAEKRFQRK